MIQHIVLLKWHTGTTDAQVDDVLAQPAELVRGIDGVEQVTVGRNRGIADHGFTGFTHAFIVNRSDDDALATYLDHPVRDRYLTDVLKPGRSGPDRDRRSGRLLPPPQVRDEP